MDGSLVNGFMATCNIIDVTLSIFDINRLNLLKIGIIDVFVSFIPLTALSYYILRHRRQRLERWRILNILEADKYISEIYNFYPGKKNKNLFLNLILSSARERFVALLAVIFATAITAFGLAILVSGCTELPSIKLAQKDFPLDGSLVVLGMSFLGSYIWGLRFLGHRYAQNDISPIVYFRLGYRMIFAPLIAFVAFNAAEIILGDSENSTPLYIWPTLAFFIGLFPQRGLYWISSKIPFLSTNAGPESRKAPLELIEGLSSNDILRLDEVGIENCFDLAYKDFVLLILETPYSARQIVDWILQAKLCIFFGESVIDLRKQGIFHITQLKYFNEQPAQNSNDTPHESPNGSGKSNTTGDAASDGAVKSPSLTGSPPVQLRDVAEETSVTLSVLRVARPSSTSSPSVTLKDIAEETSVTLSALRMAVRYLKDNEREIERLDQVRSSLGMFVNNPTKEPPEGYSGNQGSPKMGAAVPDT